MKVEVDYITLFLFVCGSGIQAHFWVLWTTGGKERREVLFVHSYSSGFCYSLRFLFAYYFRLPFSFVSLVI